MELDEKLFYLAWKAKKKFQEKKQSPYACDLSTINERLGIITTALLEQFYSIKEAELNGGIVGHTLFLPKIIDEFSDHQKNYELYLLRILNEMTYYDLGFKFKENALSQKDYQLISLLLAPTILSKTLNDFPEKSYLLKDYFSKQNEKLRKKNYTEYFFKVWSLAVIHDDILETSQLKNSHKVFIKKYIKTNNMTVHDIIPLAIIVKKELHQNGIISITDQHIELFPFLGKIPTPAQKLTLKKIDHNDLEELAKKDNETVKKSKSKENIKFIELDEKDPNCNPANLLMEGVQTTDLFSGGRKMVDGSDEMDDHFESIEDLNIQELTRSKTQTESIFNADIAIDISIEDQNEDLNHQEFTYLYDEWDYKKRKYKKNWCHVHELKIPQVSDDAMARATKQKEDIISKSQSEIKKLKHKLDQILIEKRAKPRQKDGAEFDLDAVISAKSDILANNTPSEKLYISNRRSPTDISVLFLLDSSLSAGSWIKGQKVIDIAKQSLFIAQEVLEEYFSQIMVASFYSNTRKQCHFNIIKDFYSPWKTSYHKLDSVHPTGYTRIGVALRHAFSKLKKTKSKKKIVILLSDGKPTDYDAYEGKLGISDVRQCIREANQNDIYVYSLAIDKDSKYYFPQLFGAKNYQVLNHPKLLPDQIIKLFGKII